MRKSIVILLVFIGNALIAQKIITGAEQMKYYLPLLKDKRVALVVNQTSMVGNTHLVDTLQKLKIDIKKIFAPEHGFRGNNEAGAKINSSIDKKTGLKVISLYGKNFKPTTEDLSDVDIVIFDIQDVGARFYTFISTLHYVMQACAQNNNKQKEEIQNSLGNEYAAFTLAEVYPQLFDWLSLVDTNAVIISVLMLIVSCISMITVLLIVILDKTQTIGTLKALGLSNGRTIALFWYKAVRIVIRGIVWGNIVFFVFAFMQSYFHIIQLPKKDYYVSTVPILINWSEVLIIDLGTLVLCMLCMLLPVQIVSRISTVKVLRFN